jgi:hypothetical protein
VTGLAVWLNVAEDHQDLMASMFVASLLAVVLTMQAGRGDP